MTLDDAIDIVRDAGFGYLATTHDQQPYVRPMMPFLTDDNELLLAVLPRSRCLIHIEQNPKVELCFVDRKMAYCRITGVAIKSEDLEKKNTVWNAIPMLRQYFSGPEDIHFKLIVIKMVNIETMTPYQKDPIRISLN